MGLKFRPISKGGSGVQRWATGCGGTLVKLGRYKTWYYNLQVE